jgi:hypothetical protein
MTTPWRWQRSLGFGAVLLLWTVLTSCYVPARFDAEIEIDRFGHYTMTFEGYMAQVELYNDIREKKIDADEERRRVQIIKDDFTRDSSTKSFDYYKQGYFKVKWVKTGDILAAPQVTFFRRNENILSIIYVKEKNQIDVKATPIGPDKQKTLQSMGLQMEGELRVRTDARVVANNATKEETPQNPKMRGEKLYTWTIKSITDPPAKLSIILQ